MYIYLQQILRNSNQKDVLRNLTLCSNMFYLSFILRMDEPNNISHMWFVSYFSYTNNSAKSISSERTFIKVQ